MHNSRDSTRRLSRAMPSGCTSLPESPAARCSVCRAKRIFRHASSSSGAASDPPRLLQEPASFCRLSQKTNSELFCQSKLRASHPPRGPQPSHGNCGPCQPRLYVNTGRVPPIISCDQKNVTFFQVASWKLWRILLLLPFSRIRQTRDLRVGVGRLVGHGYWGERAGFTSGQEPHQMLSAPNALDARGTAAQGPVAAGSAGEGVELLPMGEARDCSLASSSARRRPVGRWGCRWAEGGGGRIVELWPRDHSPVPGWVDSQNV